MKERSAAATKASPGPAASDDPETLAAQARDAVQRSVAELRSQRLPMATEPPTVFRP